MSIVLDGTTGITTPAATATGLISGATNYTGFKNRIINGNMAIDQRNAGASVTVNGFSVYPVDRFLGSFRPSTGTATAQKVSDAPLGFVNSLKMTQASVTSAATSDIYSLVQRIEGFNTADLGWGTANATTVTLSFWVKSSVTGAYGLTLQNINASRRSYVTTYTINSANTWEQKTVTIAGDTTGTWETTNSTGIAFLWDLGSGSDYQTSTLNAWQTANVFQANTGTRWIATSGATFYITGVQLEKGSTATSFDYRPYGTELALCQRYYTFGQNTTYISAASGTIAYNVPFLVYMRTAPTVTRTGNFWTGGENGTTANTITNYNFAFSNAGAVAAGGIWTATAEL
jgi:hypothetical protein